MYLTALIPKVLKIAPLLAQYLYTNKKLDLPGIGTFLLDSSAILPVTDNKHNKPVLLEGVSFEHNSQLKEDPELVAYISSLSGKIKPLASADLDSHLELARQFLNIGKPFLFEGIGTLVRHKQSEYSFTSGTMVAEPIKENTIREAVTQQAGDDNSGYKGIFYSRNDRTKKTWKKPLAAFLILAGFGLAVWGGYTVYKKTSSKKETVGAANNEQQDVTNDTASSAKKDTAANTTTTTAVPSTINDTSVVTVLQPPLPSGSYKFVVETADKARGLFRQGDLIKRGIKNIQLETNDSVTFRLYVQLPASVADTARILDSLRRNYTPTGKTAYVTK
jgi:hypothetical protein